MATYTIRLSRALYSFKANYSKSLLQKQCVLVNSHRNNFFFNHLQLKKDHDTDYEYEVTQDPQEWAHVEKLLPFSTVPVPETKSFYPSGWRPMKEESLNLPYFVERTRNYMLPVFLRIPKRGIGKVTVLTKIRGDIWGLYDDLQEHLYKVTERMKIFSVVHEGNCKIHIKGDYVYHVEQWLLSKGF